MHIFWLGVRGYMTACHVSDVTCHRKTKQGNDLFGQELNNCGITWAQMKGPFVIPFHLCYFKRNKCVNIFVW